MVIRNVANKEQQDTAVSLFWDLCEGKQPALKRNDPSTWTNSQWVASPSVGIMSGKERKRYPQIKRKRGNKMKKKECKGQKDAAQKKESTLCKRGNETKR